MGSRGLRIDSGVVRGSRVGFRLYRRRSCHTSFCDLLSVGGQGRFCFSTARRYHQTGYESIIKSHLIVMNPQQVATSALADFPLLRSGVFSMKENMDGLIREIIHVFERCSKPESTFSDEEQPTRTSSIAVLNAFLKSTMLSLRQRQKARCRRQCCFSFAKDLQLRTI
jgi:hypothetical protein